MNEIKIGSYVRWRNDFLPPGRVEKFGEPYVVAGVDYPSSAFVRFEPSREVYPGEWAHVSDLILVEGLRLEGVSPDDLKSSEPEVRKRALQSLARNEDILYGRVTQATASELRLLEEPQPQPA
jgi:hypothetical protein